MLERVPTILFCDQYFFFYKILLVLHMQILHVAMGQQNEPRYI